MTPTQRTLTEIRKLVEHVAIVEKWNSHCRIRQDLFGFADLISFDREDVHLWQVTASGVRSRIDKIKELDIAKHWVASQNRYLFVVGWRKLKPRGTKVAKWRPRIVSLTWHDGGQLWHEQELQAFSEVI